MESFAEEVLVTENSTGIFEGTVSGKWSVNGNPNGGYLMGILAGAMIKHSDKKSAPIVTANYISRCVPGKVEIYVEEFSRSKQFNRYSARLIQEGREKVLALVSFSRQIAQVRKV